jgi:sugar porter (SP) family MFS transporter
VPVNKKNDSSYPYFIAFVASIGGLLFGFNAGIITGALPFLKNSWGGLSVDQSNLIVISILFGATIGALLSGKLSDIYGRKTMLYVTSIIYAVGAVLSGAATSVLFLQVSRIILGAAMGISSCVIPMYISEISPLSKRGSLVSIFQLMITLGILFSIITSHIIADEFDPFSWRHMFYLGTIPAILFFIGTLFLPETPRYLIVKGKIVEGKTILRKLEPDKKADEIIEKLKSKNNESFELKKIWNSVLLIGIGLMFIQQFIGVNTIIYFTPTLFKELNSSNSAIDMSFSIGIINVLATLIFILLVDRVGRKPLFLIGLTGMSTSLILLGFILTSHSIHSNSLQWTSFVLILVYMVFFAISLGPLAWLVFSEVFPFKYRGFGMSIVAFSNWFFSTIVTIGIIKLSEIINYPYEASNDSNTKLSTFGQLFFVFAAIAVLGIIWGMKKLPETRGISLEDIEGY